MRDWLSVGCLDRDELVTTDLTSVEYGFSSGDQIVLEKKESMKKRGLASPDDGDALAITFAQPVPDVTNATPSQNIARRRRDYDPFARRR